MKDTYRSLELSPALSLSTPARDGSFVRDFWFCFFPLAVLGPFSSMQYRVFPVAGKDTTTAQAFCLLRALVAFAEQLFLHPFFCRAKQHLQL